jgi:hypothetical protein
MEDITMVRVPVSPELASLNDALRVQLEPYRARKGAFPFLLRHEQMGRSVVAAFLRDGVESADSPPVTLSPYVKAVYRVSGRTPFTVLVPVSSDGVPGEPVLELERPPRATQLRTPALYVQELELRPRRTALVPGWMKVELAAVGAWDLRSDSPTWKDLEPTGEPQTPQSVGVPAPAGAEWAVRKGTSPDR